MLHIIDICGATPAFLHVIIRHCFEDWGVTNQNSLMRLNWHDGDDKTILDNNQNNIGGRRAMRSVMMRDQIQKLKGNNLDLQIFNL